MLPKVLSKVSSDGKVDDHGSVEPLHGRAAAISVGVEDNNPISNRDSQVMCG